MFDSLGVKKSQVFTAWVNPYQLYETLFCFFPTFSGYLPDEVILIHRSFPIHAYVDWDKISRKDQVYQDLLDRQNKQVFRKCFPDYPVQEELLEDEDQD